MVLPLLRRYFLISRGFEYFVDPVLPLLRAKIGKPIPLSRPGESSAFVPQSREFGVTG